MSDAPTDRLPSGDARAGAPKLDDEVRAADPARWLASRFAPTDARGRLTALYAVHAEIARVREAVSDPMVGEIRLAWWREAIGEAYDTPDRARRHPAVLALRNALAPPAPRPPRALFDALIDARERDLDERRFATVGEVADYAEATAGGLMRIAARMLAPAGTEVARTLDAGLGAAGRAWGLAGLALAFPAHAAQGFVTAPDAPPSAEIGRLLQARDAAAVRAVAAPLVEAAGRALGEARAGLAGAPAWVWPAYGYAALVGARLRALRQEDPFALAAKPLGLRDRMRLVIAAAAGAI